MRVVDFIAAGHQTLRKGGAPGQCSSKKRFEMRVQKEFPRWKCLYTRTLAKNGRKLMYLCKEPVVSLTDIAAGIIRNGRNILEE